MRKRSGCPAARNSSQASPSSAPESWRDSRDVWVSARTTSPKRITIAKIATPTIRVPFSRSNENADEQRIGDLGAGDDRQPERDEQQDQDVGVAQLAPAPDRVAGDGDREHQPDGADRGQLRRQDVGRVAIAGARG